MTSKLDRAAVYADLRMAIARVAGAPVESIDQDTLLRDELGFDSLTAVELLIEIEDAGLSCSQTSRYGRCAPWTSSPDSCVPRPLAEARTCRRRKRR